MRWFYTDRSGRSADLCLMLDRHSVRLVVYDPSRAPGEREIIRSVFPSYTDAVSVLKANGIGWRSDLTGILL